MVKYFCPCLNVSLESTAKVLTSQPFENNIDRLKQRLNENCDDQYLLSFIHKHFLNANSNLLSSTLIEAKSVLNSSNTDQFMIGSLISNDNENKTLTPLTDLFCNVEWLNSQIEMKYPILTGILNNGSCIKLNKCFICNVFTHCLFVINESIEQQTSSNNTISSSSHSGLSLTRHKLPNPEDHLRAFLLINTQQLVTDAIEVERLKQSENYSKVFELVIDDKLAKKVEDEVSGSLKPILNIQSIIEQRKFIGRLDQTFGDRLSLTDNRSVEEVLKNKFEKLVTKLFNSLGGAGLENNRRDASGSTSGGYQLSSSQSSRTSNSINIDRKEARSLRKDDDSILSTSVFEFEEIDGSDSNKTPFLDDEENNDDTGIEDTNESDFSNEAKKSVLKKRNSNVGNETFGQIAITRQSPLQTKHDLASSVKYSCSLPRNIPGGKLLLPKKSVIKSEKEEEESKEDNNENHFKDQKRHKQNNDQRNRNQTNSINNNTKNNELNEDDYDDDDDTNNNDDIFEDENRYDESNIGEAISNLASSIVQKDGRELFGGVPSRRTNSYSVSKYD